MKTIILIIIALALLSSSGGQAAGQTCRVSTEGATTVEYCIRPGAEYGACTLVYELSAITPAGASSALYHYDCSLYRTFIPTALH